MATHKDASGHYNLSAAVALTPRVVPVVDQLGRDVKNADGTPKTRTLATVHMAGGRAFDTATDYEELAAKLTPV